MEIRPYSPGSEFYIESVTREPGWQMSYLHYHDLYELYFLEDGYHSTIIEDKLFQLFPRDVALYTPNILHKSHNTNGYSRTCIYFTTNYLKKYFSDKAISALTECFKTPVISLDDHAFSQIRQIFPLLKADNPKAEGSGAFMYLTAILAILNRNKDSYHPIQLSQEQEKLALTLRYIHQNYNSINNISEIASKLYVTKYHLCHIFKAATGLTLVEYINHIKIRQACNLLKCTEKSVTQIGADCGFNSPMYFCKTFKKLMGIAPSEYRKSPPQGRRNSFGSNVFHG